MKHPEEGDEHHDSDDSHAHHYYDEHYEPQAHFPSPEDSKA